MLRRNLVHVKRYPTIPLFVAGIPIILLLLFVYVFGGTLGAGLGDSSGAGLGSALGSGSGGRAAYLDYLVPGMLLFAIAGAAQGVSISVATDMTEGIVARFRTMAISRGAVMTGHVIGNLIQTMVALVLVVGVGVAIGYRPTGGALGWLGAFLVLALISVAIIWLAVALGMKARSVETASNSPMFLMLFPFLGSGFVPTESMPTVLRQFAEVQPFTPFIETVRALLAGTALSTGHLVATLAWSLAIGLGGYLWARRLYERRSVR
jgi:ABC-2 type transport system permease protein